MSSLALKDSATGAQAADAEFLGTDVALARRSSAIDLLIEINITAGTTPNIEISYDSGATWTVLIAALALNTLTRIRTAMITGDAINFRTPTVGGLTLARFVVITDVTG